MLAAGDERAATCGQTFHVRLLFGVGFHYRATLAPSRQRVVCRRHTWGTYFLRCAHGPGVCLRHTSLPEGLCLPAWRALLGSQPSAPTSIPRSAALLRAQSGASTSRPCARAQSATCRRERSPILAR